VIGPAGRTRRLARGEEVSRIVYVNGSFVPEAEATVSVFDRGFLFADGIYEVSAVVNGRLVDNDGHLARLERSLRAIGMELPMPKDEMVGVQEELIRRNGLAEGIVYLEVTRGAADRDFPFPKNVPQTLVMFTQVKTVLESAAARTGIRMISVPDIRWARRDIKSVALLAQVLAKQAAAEAGCQEALMHEDGTVTECGSSTAFMVTADGTVVTRPNSSAILPGITRASVQALADENGVRLEERAFTLEEAYGAAEFFITSASSFVMPVVEIDGRKIGGGQPGPVTRRLREIYIAMAKG
jgi:D-alanine transaminase